MLANYREKSTCFYQDGVFNPSQWRDIQTNVYEESVVFATQQCYYHGRGDTQSQFFPDSNVTNGELVKIAARLSRIMPQSFSHFDEPAETWYMPYLQVLQDINALYGTTVDQYSMYIDASREDIVSIMNAVMMSE